MNNVTIILSLPTEVTFNMHKLLKDIINEAKHDGYFTLSDIINYIENNMFSENVFESNIEGYDPRYCDFLDQYNEITEQLELNPLSKENLDIIKNILKSN